jgi:site-specific DNA-methyltransferase (adenine-specific)
MIDHYEAIKCPNCGKIEIAEIRPIITTYSGKFMGMDYNHKCSSCNFNIGKDKWDYQGHLIHNRFENIVPYLKSNSVDLVLTDPPFGVRKDEAWDDKRLFISQIKFWITECLRVSKHAVIWFCASKMMPYIFRAIPPELFHREHAIPYDESFNRSLDWRKPKGTQFAGASHNNIWYSKEPILIFSKDIQRTISYGGDMPFNYDYLEYDTVPKKKYGHKTSKPVLLIAKLIGHYSAPGEIILDPFAGSGTLAEACIKTERKYMCIEMSPEPDRPTTDVDGDNPDHFNTILNRIKNINDSGDFFNGI